MTMTGGKDQEDGMRGDSGLEETRKEAGRLIDPAMPMAAAGAMLDTDRKLNPKSETEEALEQVTEAEDEADDGDDDDDDEEEDDDDDEEDDEAAAADEEEEEDEGIEEAEELDDR